ncbi:MAG: DUF305 domain-containing protein [Gemmatimonadales bacterium]
MRFGRVLFRSGTAGVLVGLVVASGVAAQPHVGAAPVADSSAIARARADSARYPYTEADIRFLTGMIAHHAQALVMASWAPTHDAGLAVRRLCERIINAQQDEIRLMQHWLADRRQPVPEPHLTPTGVMMHSAHPPLMPGMLTEEQLAELSRVRGSEFDRLFLTSMIQHHRGAVEMVKELFAAEGGRDLLVFKLASDINVDQATEIRRMQQMLVELLFTEGN